MIPKIIHQIWIGPAKMPVEWMSSWREKNPSMKYMLWREKELDKFKLKFWDKCSYLIGKGEYRGATDLMRVEILERYGGIFVDADSICLAPIEKAPFMRSDFFVGKDFDERHGKYVNRVANGTIGSIPHHPILKDYIDRIDKSGIFKWWKLGGEMLTACIEKTDALVLPICTFYPTNWDGRIAPVEGKIYATHFWGETKKRYKTPGKIKVAMVSANMGNFEKNSSEHIPQTFPFDYFLFTDKNFPPRVKAMTPRLQARIVKMFSWQLAPGYDYYLWVDSSCRLASPDAVKWFLDQCEDVVVFKHPNRKTVGDEAKYLKYRLSINCPYITPRYKNELIDEQLKEINPKQPLFATTAFMYRNCPESQAMLKEWWYHTSRYHSIDQLSFPHVLSQSGLKVCVIPDNYLKIPYLKYVRKIRP